MAIDVDLLDDQVLHDILANLGFDSDTDWENDSKVDKFLKRVSEMSPGEALNAYLIWNGIIGYTGDILNAVESVKLATKD